MGWTEDEAPLPQDEQPNASHHSLLDEALLTLFAQNSPRLFERIEEAVLRAAFRYCAGNQLKTARLLGISRNVVRARLIHFGEIAGTLRSSRSEGVPRDPSGNSPSR